MDLELANKVAIVTGASRGIARVVAFLVSPGAGYIQGAILDVDGGATRAL